MFIIAIFAIAFTTQAQNTWTQKAKFGGCNRTGAVGFSINGKGYIGTGENFRDKALNDFWEYDPSSDSWTQKASFGGHARYNAVGFSIGNKGYIGTGSAINYYHIKYFNDFWEYDPAANIWTRKAYFPGVAREAAVGFSINERGYIGTGVDFLYRQYNDFWEYDPTTDSWKQKANFPSPPRWFATGFSINGKGYIGTGESFTTGTAYNDLWEYDPTTDLWTPKASFNGEKRMGAVGFSINGKGYIGTGRISDRYLNDFWEYDPSSNDWTQEADFAGKHRSNAVGFSINNNGYIGTGFHIAEWEKDFWEYTPDNFIASHKIETASGNNTSLFNLYPNPSNGIFTVNLNMDNEQNAEAHIEVLNPLGQIIHAENGRIENGKLMKEIKLNASPRVYLVKVIIANQVFEKQISLQ